MLDIEIIVFAVSGFLIGWFIPHMYRGVIEFKCTQRSRDAPKFSKAAAYNFIFGIINMIFYILVVVLEDKIPVAISAALLITLAIIITAVDIKIRLIPNELLMVLLGIGLVYRFSLSGISAMVSSAAGALIMVMLFGISGKLAGFSKVGAGDLKLAFAIGLICASTNITPALMVMALTMAFVSIGGLIIGKLRRTDMIPFAGFMMAGMVTGILNSLNISTIKMLF